MDKMRSRHKDAIVKLIECEDRAARETVAMQNPVENFFTSLAANDIQGILDSVNDDVVFEAQGPTSVPIYGKFVGKEGVKRFVSILVDLFENEKFDIYKWSMSDDFIFAHGYMQHRVRSSDRVFKCEWALVCQIKNDRISSYKMFEDTAALEMAYCSGS